MSDNNATGYIEPTNYTMARKLAREVFGYVILKNEWDEYQVYKVGMSHKDAASVYFASDWEDAWGTMKSMWRAEKAQEKVQSND